MNLSKSNLQETQILKLSIEDSKEFVHALLNPPQANEALKKADLIHKHLISTITDINP